MNYPLFGDEGVNEFDSDRPAHDPELLLELRAATRTTRTSRDVFAPRHAGGTWASRTTRSRYYHLYINGQYWGLYQTQERAEAGYAATYFGGDAGGLRRDQVDRQLGGYQIEATDGNIDGLDDRLWNAAKAGFATNDAYYCRPGARRRRHAAIPANERLLDVDNLIDYMICIYYGGDLDAPISNFLGNTRANNFYAIYNRDDPTGFKFFRHDAEHTLDHGMTDRTGPYPHRPTRTWSCSPTSIRRRCISI